MQSLTRLTVFYSNFHSLVTQKDHAVPQDTEALRGEQLRQALDQVPQVDQAIVDPLAVW